MLGTGCVENCYSMNATIIDGILSSCYFNSWSSLCDTYHASQELFLAQIEYFFYEHCLRSSLLNKEIGEVVYGRPLGSWARFASGGVRISIPTGAKQVMHPTSVLTWILNADDHSIPTFSRLMYIDRLSCSRVRSYADANSAYFAIL